MPLITFIPIPTKFVGAGFPADVYICKRDAASRYECAHVRACVYIISVNRRSALLKFGIDDNPQIDRNLDDKASVPGIRKRGNGSRCTIPRHDKIAELRNPISR